MHRYREAIHQAVKPLLLELSFICDQYLGGQHRYVSRGNYNYHVTIDYHVEEDFGRVTVLKRFPGKSVLDIVGDVRVSSQHINGPKIIELLHQHDYEPATTLHRKRMLNLLIGE